MSDFKNIESDVDTTKASDSQSPKTPTIGELQAPLAPNGGHIISELESSVTSSGNVAEGEYDPLTSCKSPVKVLCDLPQQSLDTSSATDDSGLYGSYDINSVKAEYDSSSFSEGNIIGDQSYSAPSPIQSCRAVDTEVNISLDENVTEPTLMTSVDSLLRDPLTASASFGEVSVERDVLGFHGGNVIEVECGISGGVEDAESSVSGIDSDLYPEELFSTTGNCFGSQGSSTNLSLGEAASVCENPIKEESDSPSSSDMNLIIDERATFLSPKGSFVHDEEQPLQSSNQGFHIDQSSLSPRSNVLMRKFLPPNGESMRGELESPLSPIGEDMEYEEALDEDIEEPELTEDEILLMAKRCASKKLVTFADERFQENFVTYAEYENPVWEGVEETEVSTIIQNYKIACQRVTIGPEDIILKQLQKIEKNDNYTAELNIKSVSLDADVLETIETIFQHVNFRIIHMGRCEYFAAEIFEMLAYYDPAIELILTEVSSKDDYVIWNGLAEAVANSKNLTSVSFREANISNASLTTLFEIGFNSNWTVTKLRFDGCMLVRSPAFFLFDNLKKNNYIVELHLCYVDLFSREMDVIGRYLSDNTQLRILDLSNNKIGDTGFESLVRGLTEQARIGSGVEVLILFGNKLTYRCSSALKMFLLSCSIVHTLNLGMNNLTDYVIRKCKNTLIDNRNLKALGLQASVLTCEGVGHLAEIVISNHTLQCINIRGNKAIQPRALNMLADTIHHSGLIHVDLEDQNRSCSNPQQFTEIVNRIRQLVAINKHDLDHEALELHKEQNVEHFLSCETVYMPQWEPRSTKRAKSSSTASRFSVEKVPESALASKVTAKAAKVRDAKSVGDIPEDVEEMLVDEVIEASASELESQNSKKNEMDVTQKHEGSGDAAAQNVEVEEATMPTEGAGDSTLEAMDVSTS